MDNTLDIDGMIAQGKAHFDSTIAHLQDELVKVRAGKANPSMLDGIMVSYYGNPTPLRSVANLGTADSRTITVQPWEKNMLAPIEKAIFEANLGITPMNDGEFIRIGIPPLTEERRKALVKQCKGYGEEAKVGIRNERHKMMDFIKKEVKEGYPEDAGKRKEATVETLVKDYYTKVEEIVDSKEKEVMTG